MDNSWVPVWLSIAGSAGTIAVLIVTHILSKRTTNEQTATLQAATVVQTATLSSGQDSIKDGQATIGAQVEGVAAVSNGRLADALGRKDELTRQVAAQAEELKTLRARTRATDPVG